MLIVQTSSAAIFQISLNKRTRSAGSSSRLAWSCRAIARIAGLSGGGANAWPELNSAPWNPPLEYQSPQPDA